MLILCYIFTQKDETFDLLKLAQSTYVSNIFTNQNNWIILGILESVYPKPLLMAVEWA